MLAEGSRSRNHTFGHVNLTKQSRQEILDQLGSHLGPAIAEGGAGFAGKKSLSVTPYGAFDDTLKKTSPYPLILVDRYARLGHQNADQSVATVMREVRTAISFLMRYVRADRPGQRPGDRVAVREGISAGHRQRIIRGPRHCAKGGRNVLPRLSFGSIKAVGKTKTKPES